MRWLWTVENDGFYLCPVTLAHRQYIIGSVPDLTEYIFIYRFNHGYLGSNEASVN